MSDPNSPRGMSVTVKMDGKDATWFVFHGTPAAIRESMVETFKFEDGQSELTLHELALEATRIVKATGTAGKVLGARPVAGSTGDAWDQARGAAPATEAVVPPTLAELIEATTTVDELRELWLDKSEAIKADSLVDAWKEKGAALKSAA